MKTKLRTWRVQTVKNGMKAPIFLVQTMEFKLWKAKAEAEKKALKRSILLEKYGFKMILEEIW